VIETCCVRVFLRVDISLLITTDFMSDIPASSLYLACVSSSSKKRYTRQLKAVQEELDLLVDKHAPTILIHREGAKNVPFAWQAFHDELAYHEVQLAYFFSASPEKSSIYLTNKASKRQELDIQNFSWQSFPDIHLLILDGPYSKDRAERFLFAGVPAVFLLPKGVDRRYFRFLFFTQLLKGARLRKALEETAKGLEIQIPHYSIPSDPYEYSEWKENVREDNEDKGCLIHLDKSGNVLDWTWTAFGYTEEDKSSEPIEEEEEASEWFELSESFSTWTEAQVSETYAEVREREYRHIAVRNGGEAFDPIQSEWKDEMNHQASEAHAQYSQSSYELVPTSYQHLEEEEIHAPQPEAKFEEEGFHRPDMQPEASASQSFLSWPVLTWATLALCLLALSSLAYMMPGRQTPRISDFQFLSNFNSASSYNVLLLPFEPVGREETGIPLAERSVKDWVNTLKESQDLGVNVIYAQGSQPPQTTEEAKRIGEIYEASLVIWGDYGNPSADSNLHHLRYVSPNADYSTEEPGAAAFNDVYDLQEGFLTGAIEDINYWILATAYLKKGDYQSAYTNLQLMQRKQGRGAAVVHHMIAKCYLGLEYFGDCIDSYSQAIKLDPGNANSYFQRAYVYEMQQQTDQAILDYQRALEMNPNHLKAKSRLKALESRDKQIEVKVPRLNDPQNGSFTLLEGKNNFGSEEEKN